MNSSGDSTWFTTDNILMVVVPSALVLALIIVIVIVCVMQADETAKPKTELRVLLTPQGRALE